MTQPSESQLVLLLDDNVEFTNALAAGLEREGRTIVTCNDVESAQLVVERLRPSHVVSDVRLSGPFAFEGLEFIKHTKRHSAESRVIMMTGDAPEALQEEASRRGAIAFLQKPFDVQELDAMLGLWACSALSSAADPARIVRMPLLDDIVSSNALGMFFQPIVDLGTGDRCIGYEALARYDHHSMLRNPAILFEYASRKHRVADLELACVSRSLAAGAHLGGMLFINLHPDVFLEGDQLREVIERDARQHGVALDRIVLEITEQGSLHEDRSVFETIGRLRAAGVRFALDDVGVAYSHLPFIDRIHPSFLKISQHFGTAFETDATKTKIVTNIFSLGRDFHCELILEGIENASTADAAARMGIRYGQGFLFGRPEAAPIA